MDWGTKLIGYTCSYIPVELLSATGFQPYRLLHGDRNLLIEGEKLVRVDACPLVKANLGYLMQNQKEFVALVGSTGCDLARRLFDVVMDLTPIPVYLIHNPRTDNPEIFNEEIDWLCGQLENLSGKRFTQNLLVEEIEKWEGYRQSLRTVSQMLSLPPTARAITPHPTFTSLDQKLSAQFFHQLCINYHKGKMITGDEGKNDDQDKKIPGSNTGKPRVYLLGSPIPYEANLILQLLERDLSIVGDFNCGLSRFLNIEIKEKNLDGIKSAYYHQPPCPFKRPNQHFYEWISEELKRLNCSGIVVWTLDYCDHYEFELSRMERKFGLPVLRIRSDLSFQNIAQTKLRIGSFAEMLGAE